MYSGRPEVIGRPTELTLTDMSEEQVMLSWQNHAVVAGLEETVVDAIPSVMPTS